MKKEAYHKVAALLGQASDPGRTFRPRPIPLRIDAPNYVNTLVMGKRNGSAILYMWRDVDLWNSSTKRRKSVSPVDVTVVDSDGRRTVPVGASSSPVASTADVRRRTLAPLATEHLVTRESGARKAPNAG